MRHLALVTAMIFAATGTAPARADTGNDAGDRAYIAVNGGYQTRSSSVDGALTFAKFVETETVISTYKIAGAPGFDVTGGLRIWRRLAVGAGVSRFTRTNSAAVSASIPHPFFFNGARQISGDAGGIRHEETAFHVNAAWMAPVGTRWLVTVFGGPSLFNVAQSLVTDVSYNDSYPYESPAFGSASTSSQSKSKIGAHAGVDVAFMFARHAGVGGLMRFSRSALNFSTANGQTVHVDAGGLQGGVGLRLQF